MAPFQLSALTSLLALTPSSASSFDATPLQQNGAPDCSSSTSSSSRYHALMCWLYNAQLKLPDEQFQEGIFSVTIDSLTCTSTSLSSLSTSYTLPPPLSPALTPLNPVLHFILSGISTSCKGQYQAELFSGDVEIVVGGNAMLDLEVGSLPLEEVYRNSSAKKNNDSTGADGETGVKEELPFPTLTTLTKCQTDLSVTTLNFSGSLSSKIIGLFSGTIGDTITDELKSHVCGIVKKNLEKSVEGALGVVGRYLGGLIYDPKSLNELSLVQDDVSRYDGLGQKDYSQYRMKQKDVKQNQDMVAGASLEKVNLATTRSKLALSRSNRVKWHDMPLLQQILSTTNNFISRHMNEGIILPLLQNLNTYPSTMDTLNCQDCGFFFKGLNGLINSFTNGTGSKVMEIPPSILGYNRNYTWIIPNYGNLTLEARQFQIDGLDNLTSFQLLDPRGDDMLFSGISTDEGLNISLLLDLTVLPSNQGEFHAGMLNESFSVSFQTSALNLTATKAVELDAEIYKRLSVGSFMFGSYTVFESNKNRFNCFLEMLNSVVFTGMNARMNLDGLHVVPTSSEGVVKDGSLEDDMDQMIDNIVQMMLLQYPTTVTESLAALIQSPARLFLNEIFASYIGDFKKHPLHCTNVDIPDKKMAQPLHLDTNGAIVLFNEVVDSESTIDSINAFIECVLKVVTSNNLFDGHFYNVTLGEYTLVFRDLQLENANSIYELGMLHPEIDSFHLSNKIGYGNPTPGGENMALSFGMNLLHDKHGEIANVMVHSQLNNFKLNAGTELKFDMNWLPQLRISDLLSHPQCISIPLTEMSFYGFNTRVETLSLDINVVVTDGESPGTSTQYVTNNSTELAHLISNLMTEGAKLTEERMIKSSNSLMKQGALICETPANPLRTHMSERSTAAAGLWTFLIVVGFVVGNAWLFMRGFKSHREGNGPEGAGTETQPSSTETNVQEDEGKGDEPEFTSMTEPLLNNDGLDEVLEVESPPKKFPLASSSSLMFHPSIQPVVKYGFPAVIALALILFIASNISIGTSVDLFVTGANGKHVASANIYAFSLGSTLHEMWQAGVYLLMLLILFCSGVWPYVKLLALLFCWMSSTRRLPPVKREQILYLLDSLGKFSLIDAYVLVLMMVAFRYGLVVEGVGEINVYTTPTFGFYAFLFATIMSLVIGHVMLFLHRRTLVPKIPVYSGRHESLSKHIFEDKHGRGLVKLTRRFRRTIVFTMLVTFILICVGVNLKCFHFTFNGVAGAALGQSKVREFSLVSIGEHIPQSVQDPSTFGIHWIQTCYFFFALAMPLVCLLCLFVLFVYPMTIKQQQKVFILAEVTNAWSAIEVFVIAIVASLVEISPFSQSMVSEHCNLLNQILSGWTGEYGDQLHQCFGVKSSLDGSSAVLIIGVLLNSFLISTLHRFSHHAMWERIEREDRPNASEDETKTVRECVLAHTFVSQVRKIERVGRFVFDDVSFGPHSEYEIDFENVAENEEPDTENFWSEWRKVVSVI